MQGMHQSQFMPVYLNLKLSALPTLLFCRVQVCMKLNISINQREADLRKKLLAHEIKPTHANIVSHVPGMSKV